MGVKMFLLPFVVLGLSRLGAEVSVRLLPMRIAWIPALLVYYLAIGGAESSASTRWGCSRQDPSRVY